MALAASEARYRALAETTSDVITQLDMGLRRRYVSPSCRKVLGYEPAEMLDVMPSGRMHPEDAPGVRALALRLVAGEVEGVEPPEPSAGTGDDGGLAREVDHGGRL